MAELCLITTCMGRLAHLRQTLGAAVAQPGCSCIVVDYSCPDQCGDWVAAHYPTVKVVRVPGQANFSIARARNAGALAADAPWLCFFDADVILAPNFTEQIRAHLRADHFYLADSAQVSLLGTMVCARAAFETAGGYDELIHNWGGEDRDMYDRLRFHGLTQSLYSDRLVNVIPHDDAVRVAHFAIKSTRLSQTINMLYRVAKLDLMRLLTRDLTADERRSLYVEAERLGHIGASAGKEGKWQIPFRHAQSLLGVDMDATLVYTIRLPRNELPAKDSAS